VLDRIIMTRPEDLLYTVDELPPWPRLLFLGMQHAVLMSVYLVLIVIVFRHADASYAATLNALSFGMIALAASTVLQSISHVRLCQMQASEFVACEQALVLGPSGQGRRRGR
jgi:xanthine/uracil permease